MTHLEDRLLAAYDECDGYQHPWKHDTGPRFPRQVGSIPASLVDPDHHFIGCSSLTTFEIMATTPDIPWTIEDYGDLQTFQDRLPGRPLCALEAVERRQIAHRIDSPDALRLHADYTAGRPCILIAGWRKTGSTAADFRGHSMIAIVRPHDLLVLESTTIVDGLRKTVTTWPDLKKRFPALLACSALRLI